MTINHSITLISLKILRSQGSMAVQISDNEKCLESAGRATQRVKRPGWVLRMEIMDRFPICCLENLFSKHTFNALRLRKEARISRLSGNQRLVCDYLGPWKYCLYLIGPRNTLSGTRFSINSHCCSKESAPHWKPCLLWKIHLALSATTALQNRSTYPQGQENHLCTNFSGYLIEGLILSTYFLLPDLVETLCHVLRENVVEISSTNLRKPLPGAS